MERTQAGAILFLHSDLPFPVLLGSGSDVAETFPTLGWGLWAQAAPSTPGTGMLHYRWLGGAGGSE